MKKIAVIDIGSNTVRLVIFLVQNGKMIKEIENIKVSARLQTYLDSGVLSERGQDILLQTLASFRSVLSVHGDIEVKAFATAAIRNSRNQQEVVEKVLHETGINIEVLSGEQEAFYGFSGILSSVDLEDGLTVDLGGGSLEITRFLNRKMVNSHSFPFGVLSLSDQFIAGHVPTAEELQSLTTYLQGQLDSLLWLRNTALPIIGIGGSARNMAEIDQFSKKYPLASTHRYEMGMEDLQTMMNQLSGMSLEELHSVQGLSKDRTDIFIPAVAVFLTIFGISKAPFFTISQKGLREGIVGEIQDRKNESLYDRKSELFEQYKAFASMHNVDMPKRDLVWNLAEGLFRSIEAAGLASFSETDLLHLKCANQVYGIGECLGKDDRGVHAFYLLSNKEFNQLSHHDRVRIALIASYQSKNTFKTNTKLFKMWFEKDEKQTIQLLGSVLKFANALSSTRRQIFKDVRFNKTSRGIHLEMVCSNDWLLERMEAEKHLKHIANAIGHQISVDFVKDHHNH